MLGRLVLESRNFLYVYHSGSVDRMHFMGMTPQAYKSAKGSYKVCCFPGAHMNLKECIEEIEEDFENGKLYGKDYMNINSGLSKEKSIDCAKEFYGEVLDSQIISGLETKNFLVDKDTGLGIEYKNYDKIEFCVRDDVTVDVSSKLNTDVVVGFKELLKEKVCFAKKSNRLLEFINKRSTRNSRYVVLSISENSFASIVDFFNINNTNIKEIEKVNEIFKNANTDVEYVLYDCAYIL